MRKGLVVFVFLALSVEMMAQNVGINTLNPANTLDINGAIRFRPTYLDATSNNVVVSPEMGFVILTGTPTDIIQMTLTGTSVTGNVIIVSNNTTRDAYLEDHIVFSGEIRLYIFDDDLYRGIDGNAWQVGGNYLTSPGYAFLGTASNHPISFFTNGAERMRLLTGGTLGVGTPTPNTNYKLDVNGLASFSGLRTIGASNSLIFHDQVRPSREFRWLGNGGYARFKFVPHASDAIIVDSLNRVSFGGTNPSAWFNVEYAANNQLARFNGGNSMWITLAENNANRGYIGSYAGSPEDVDFGTYAGNSTGKLHLATGGSIRMTIDPSGNAGIGAFPTAGNRLTVHGGDLVVRENGGVAYIQMDSDQQSILELRKNNEAKHFLGSNGTNLFLSRSGLSFNNDMILDQDGDFGINLGLLLPSSKLHIAGGADASYATNGFLMLGQLDFANVVFDDNEILARFNGGVSDLSLQRDGGNLLLCGDEKGAVGIGLASSANLPAGSLLAVDGKITCEEVLVKLSQNWPDYVFADDFPLMPLEEIKQYIETHHHLPGIPKAQEIETEGLPVGEMQRLMMQKIEELTLHMIRLNELNMELKARVAELEHENSK